MGVTDLSLIFAGQPYSTMVSHIGINKNGHMPVASLISSNLVTAFPKIATPSIHRLLSYVVVVIVMPVLLTFPVSVL